MNLAGVSCDTHSIYRVSILSTHCAGGKIEKNEMGGACVYGGGERCAQGSGGET